MKKIAVFCGSSTGKRPEYIQAARQLAKVLVKKNITLIYGAGSTGIMGEIANSILENSGEVIGITPSSFLAQNVIHLGLSELHVVDSMHQRKAMMAEMADGFIALPGGLGTFEEVLEILSWAQINLHSKPIGLLNVNRYYDGLLKFLRQAVEEEFVQECHVDYLSVTATPEELLEIMIKKAGE